MIIVPLLLLCCSVVFAVHQPLVLEGFPVHFNQWVVNNPWTDEGSRVFVYLGTNKINSIPSSADGKQFFDFYHSSLVFYRNDEWFCLELYMNNAFDIPAMFSPTDSMTWSNEAFIRMHFIGHRNSRPTEFENLISIGETNGKEFAKILMFVFDYIRKMESPLRYDVFTLINEDNEIIRSARSCFEFIEKILGIMEMKLSEPIVSYTRDTVFVRIMHAKMHALPYPDEVVEKYNNFLSQLNPDLDRISKHVVYLRIVFAKFYHSQTNWWFGGLDNDEIWEVTLSPNHTDNGCKELVTLIPTRQGELGRVNVLRSGWSTNSSACVLPHQHMHELKKFISDMDLIDSFSRWTVAVWVSLGVILLTILMIRIRKFQVRRM
jgi:hypothetical protein